MDFIAEKSWESRTGGETLAERIEGALTRARAEPASALAAWEAYRIILEASAYERFKDAIEVSAAHVESIARSESMLLDYGYVAWVARESDLAEICCKRALSMNQGNETTYRRLATAYLTSQRWLRTRFWWFMRRGVRWGMRRRCRIWLDWPICWLRGGTG